MRYPKPLKQGAVVGLVAPSSPVENQECIDCEKRLREMGFQVIVAKSLKRGAKIWGYLAGEARERAEEMNEMFQNPQVEAVFCIRGGYGSSQLLEYLDYETIRRNPKVFVGFSDITSLHSVFQRYCDFVTFHGPMVKSNFLDGPGSEEWEYMVSSLWKACSGRPFFFQNPGNERMETVTLGQASGRLTGGNLSVLAKSLGTPYEPDFQDAILFLEDVGETVPRIDMYLTQLYHAGVFHRVRGVLLGDFTDCTNHAFEPGLMVKDFLREWFGGQKVPVLGNLYSDHRKVMGTLPMGAMCWMDAGDQRVMFWPKEEQELTALPGGCKGI